ncbi:MAG: transposase, partial [Aquificaceae bacterium]|nr:transposase [Aquificaceae bacterium]
VLVADATGFGYDDTVKLNYLRGRQIREVKAHVKTEVLIGVGGKKKIVLGVAVGKAYSDELKLLWAILDRAEFKAQHFVADGYYDSVRLIKHFEQRQIKCVTPISERTRQEVRNRYRKLVKESYEDERYYRKIYQRSRYDVEQLFGNVRRACGDRDNTRLYELASVFVLVRFILWNLMTLVKLSFLCFSTCGVELLSYAHEIILKHSQLFFLTF